MRYFKALAVAAVATMGFQAVPAQADMVHRTICVFDIIGANGDTFNLMKDYKTVAVGWGVDLTLKPYTDEKIAAEDLKAGQCDGAVLTDLRMRQFNSYAGSMSAIGAIPSYKELHTVMRVLESNNPSINKHLKTNNYNIAGMFPMGAAYLFVKDKSIDTVGELSGKSIAVMDYDPAEAEMAAKVGMSPVPSDITNFAGRFNNNSVDICFAPVAAYAPLELYKGMQPNGGIIKYTLGQLTSQLALRNSKFSDDFAAKSRTWMLGQFDRAMNVINNAQESVDDKWWINIPHKDKLRYDEMLREARISMTKSGIYNKDLMSLLYKVRCKYDPARAECSDTPE